MNNQTFHPVIKGLPMVHGQVSIQASDGHCCSPQDNDGPYSEWEVKPSACPAEAVALLEEYESGNDIYAFVPTQVVAAFVKACGGAKGMLLHPFALHSEAKTRVLTHETRRILNEYREEKR